MKEPDEPNMTEPPELAEQKRLIVGRASTVYTSVDEVPDQLVRTPLQCAIQIVKRHRDVLFNGKPVAEYASISMIVTTSAVHLYQGEADINAALSAIVSKLHGLAGLVEYQSIAKHSRRCNSLGGCRTERGTSPTRLTGRGTIRNTGTRTTTPAPVLPFGGSRRLGKAS